MYSYCFCFLSPYHMPKPSQLIFSHIVYCRRYKKHYLSHKFILYSIFSHHSTYPSKHSNNNKNNCFNISPTPHLNRSPLAGICPIPIDSIIIMITITHVLNHDNYHTIICKFSPGWGRADGQTDVVSTTDIIYYLVVVYFERMWHACVCIMCLTTLNIGPVELTRTNRMHAHKWCRHRVRHNILL